VQHPRFPAVANAPLLCLFRRVAAYLCERCKTFAGHVRASEERTDSGLKGIEF